MKETNFNIELHGEKFPVVVNWNSLVEFSDQAGADFFETVKAADSPEKLQRQFKMKPIMQLVTCCINEGFAELDDPRRMNYRELGRLLSPINYGTSKLPEILKILQAAFEKYDKQVQN